MTIQNRDELLEWFKKKFSDRFQIRAFHTGTYTHFIVRDYKEGEPRGNNTVRPEGSGTKVPTKEGRQN